MKTCYYSPSQWWKLNYGLSSAVSGQISGRVTLDGTAKVNWPVYLYYSKTMALLRKALTDASGNYAFAGLDTADSEAYSVTFKDPTSAEKDLVFDRLTPE